MFVLAHLSDPHLGPLPPPRLSDLLSKRLLGFVNWRLRRFRQHRADVLETLGADLVAAAPDHVAVTGDLINIALKAEFAPARTFLERLGSPDRVTLVPGNHDVYVRATAGHAEHLWSAYMRGDEASAGSSDRVIFPFLRRRGPIALIGLSSALPTAPLMATGRLGAEQIKRLAELLASLRRERAFRVVLIHHPPLSDEPRHKRLTDAPPLRRVLQQHGAELVLHGHDHRHALAWLDGPGHRIPAVGVPSASSAPNGREDAAAYNLYRIDGAPDAWRCEMISRGLRRDGGIAELARRVLAG